MRSYNEMLREVRASARDKGMIFKKDNCYINSKQAWKFTDKETGQTIARNFTVYSAYIESLNGCLEHLAR